MASRHHTSVQLILHISVGVFLTSCDRGTTSSVPWLDIILLIAVALLSTSIVLTAFLSSARIKSLRKDLAKTTRKIASTEKRSTVAMAKSREIRQRMDLENVKLRKDWFWFYGFAMQAYVEANSIEDENERHRAIYESIEDLIGDLGADGKNQRRFEMKINQKMENVMARYRTAFPDMKWDDYRLVSYLFAGFGTKLIAHLLDGITEGAVNTRKSRIRKIIRESDVADKELFLYLID